MLAAAFGGATAGRPKVVLVHGASGTGKSRLIAEFLRARPEVPATVVAAAAAEAALSYAVVHQIALAAAAGPVKTVLPDGAAAVLAELRPERLSAAADPLAVGAGLRVLFTALCQRHPAVVVLEDMHWSDPLSASALLFACRRLADDRLTLLVSAVLGWPEPGSGWARFLNADHRTAAIRLAAADAGLTTQERRVAQLVASGLSNRETASQLFVSQKTVEFHLGNAYAKLGVRSRHQLALVIR